MTSKEIIGRNLKYYRYQSGLSQEAFYAMHNLSPKYLACVERGEINISIDFIDKLSRNLNISIADLLNADESRVINLKRIDSKNKNSWDYQLFLFFTFVFEL